MVDTVPLLGISLTDLARWIIGRQTTHMEEDETKGEEQSSQARQPEATPLPSSPLGSPHAARFSADIQSPRRTAPARVQTTRAPTLHFSEKDLAWAGFNGRLNKIADTCYCFWNIGALSVSIPPFPIFFLAEV